MHKPQLENGYIEIACGEPENDVLLALASSRLNGTQFSLILIVIRKTWGWKKQWDWISYTSFQKLTGGKDRKNLAREINKLIVAKILLVDKKNIRQPRYKFNKNFNEWNRGEFAPSGEKANAVGVYTPPQIVANPPPTKENKETTKIKGENYFILFLVETDKRVVSKAQKHDVRPKDVVYCAKQAQEWCVGNEVKDNIFIWFDSFFNRWIIRAIKNHDLATLSSKAEKEAQKTPVKRYKNRREMYADLGVVLVDGSEPRHQKIVPVEEA